MKYDRCKIEKNFKKIIGNLFIPIISVVGFTFITGFYYERNVFVKLNDITVELGEKLPEEITNHNSIITDKSNLMIESGVPLDEEGRTIKIGIYPYYLVYNDENYKFSKMTNARASITVVDTTKPIIHVNENVEIEYGNDINIDDLAKCIDLSTCTMQLKEDIDTKTSGEYEVTIEATDDGRNTNSAKTIIKVLEKPVPVYQPIYRYIDYSIYYQNYNDYNNSLNMRLSEEEKNNLRNSIAEYSKLFIGNPYVYGGTSLTNGADCSGFTMSIYNTFGYILPRAAASQAYVGIPVSANELLPGDLVVYYYGHAGIYVGNGLMMHASTPQNGIILAPIFAGDITYRRIIY